MLYKIIHNNEYEIIISADSLEECINDVYNYLDYSLGQYDYGCLLGEDVEDISRDKYKEEYNYVIDDANSELLEFIEYWNNRDNWEEVGKCLIRWID